VQAARCWRLADHPAHHTHTRARTRAHRFYGETVQSVGSDVEFWAEVASFVDKLAGCQRAIIQVRAAALAAPARELLRARARSTTGPRAGL
jgi:hypothetical protein